MIEEKKNRLRAILGRASYGLGDVVSRILFGSKIRGEIRLLSLLEDRVRALESQLRILSLLLEKRSTAESGRRSLLPDIVPAPWPAKDLHDEIFILGSGASLLDLTGDEVAALNRSCCIAMNKYLIFWRKIGIWPTHVFLADIHWPAPKVLEELLRAAFSQAQLPHFILAEDYRSWPLPSVPRSFFKRPQNFGDYPWAQSLDEPMYFHRGSLTCLLNLLAVVRPARRVTLLGVDLNSSDSFYEEELRRMPDLNDQWTTLGRSVGRHATAIATRGLSPIQDRLGWVFEQMEKREIKISCYNPKSLLVELKLCPLRERLTESTLQ